MTECQGLGSAGRLAVWVIANGGMGKGPAVWLPPVDFESILDSADAVDPAQDFLRHLLVVVRADGPSEHDIPFLGLEPHSAAREMGTLIQSLSDQFVENRFVAQRFGGQRGRGHNWIGRLGGTKGREDQGELAGNQGPREHAR